uniref:Uncharacterized protein n=1 Tax=Solanum tuberosum TaxID=4113 RepID=M1DZ68_SOLTU
MAPKGKNVDGGAGSKRSRKGDVFGSSSSQTPSQKFGKQAVEQYGKEWFECQKEAKYLGDEYVNEAQDMSHGPVLSALKRQVRDDSWMARMFGMAELQLRIRGRHVTDEEIES